MTIAQIENGRIVAVDRTADAVPPGWVLVPDLAVCGMLYENGALSDPPADPAAAIRAEIAALEATATPRRMREAALTDAGRAWLADLDAAIAALRAQL